MAQLLVHAAPSLKCARLRYLTKTIHHKFVPSSFLKTYAKNKSFIVYTHGCQANYRDSEIYRGLLTKVGFKITNDVNNANIILINTCAVRENAENKVLAEIGNFKRLKNKKNVTLIITGCMAMEETIVNTIIKTYPHVDILLGTDDIAELPNVLEEHLKKHHRIVMVHSDSFNIHEKLPSVRDSTFKAFVNITYGCDNFCTYCIVPYTRGRQRSRDLKDIINECQALVKMGYQEITLLGQNVDSYGLDLKTPIPFAKLLDEVAKLKIPRLSFLTSHPADFSLDTAPELYHGLSYEGIHRSWTEAFGDGEITVTEKCYGIFKYCAEFRSKKYYRIAYFAVCNDDLLLECSMDVKNPNKKKKLINTLVPLFEQFALGCKRKK